MRFCTCFTTLLIITIGVFADDSAFNNEPSLNQLDQLSLSELMEVIVTSSGKKPERLSQTATAIFVITNDDLRRSGATTIMEALRMVPGLQVARLDSGKWAISSRGFNGRFANKLLVLIDGRSVYTPTFSGVHWDMQDLVLEDIDRIEVIRGPGATLWGANAVNGIINIMTKNAKDTQGTLLSVGGGSEERAFTQFRYGAAMGDDVHYRFFGKFFERDDFVDNSDRDATDDWDGARGGFRVDWEVSESDSLALHGEIFDHNSGQTYTLASLDSPPTTRVDGETDTRGGNLVGRWNHILDNESDLSLQLFVDRHERRNAVIDESTDVIDFDFQHRFLIGDRQEIVWGLGYRFVNDNFDDTETILFADKNSRDSHFYSAFFQDEITLIEDRLKLTLGSKFEHNYYTGVEVQPNIRLLFTPTRDQTFWAAISRAVRTPSRIENDGRLNSIVLPVGHPDNPSGMPLLISLFGDRNFEPEELLAYELGYRVQTSQHLVVDVAMFYNEYDNQRTLEIDRSRTFPESEPGPAHLVTPTFVDNKMDGETYGVEVAAGYPLTEHWRLNLAYTFQRLHFHLDNDSVDTVSEAAEGESPQQQVSLRSSTDLTDTLTLDLWFRFVDSLPAINIDPYSTLDIRLAWQATDNLECSIVGQNLLDGQHPEFSSSIINTLPTQTERSIYGKLVWQF